MATINNIYVHVTDEEISHSSKIPQHPVEKGLPLTDGVRNEPMTLSISGKIVDTSQYHAADIISKIEALRTGGSLIKYSGRNILGNFLIQSFETSHPNTNWGGADFSMELVEVRIAKSAYDPSKQKKAEEKKQATAPKLEVGAIVVFKGGAVYVSSDAKKAAATRERQTCKITKISTKSWSIHQYHLISTEKKYPYNVYGWVDKANIEGVSGTATTKAATTNAGTQQPKTKKTTTPKTTGDKFVAVYHTTKAGDTLHKLVTVTYKHLGQTEAWVRKQNPNAFYKVYNSKTKAWSQNGLKVGVKLLMGYSHTIG